MSQHGAGKASTRVVGISSAPASIMTSVGSSSTSSAEAAAEVAAATAAWLEDLRLEEVRRFNAEREETSERLFRYEKQQSFTAYIFCQVDHFDFFQTLPRGRRLLAQAFMFSRF